MIKNGMNDLLAGTKKIVNKLEDHELLDRYSVAIAIAWIGWAYST